MITIDRVKTIVTERPHELSLRPLLLFRGGLSIGQVQGRWNLLRIFQEVEAPTFAAMSRFVAENPDIAHLCGVHPPKTRYYYNKRGAASPNGAPSHWMRSFFSRVVVTESVWSLAPAVRDYVQSVIENSGGWTPHLQGIPLAGEWSRRSWRREAAGVKIRSSTTKPPAFYPFIDTIPTTDHDLILSVHSCVPKGLNEDTRQDLCQDLLVAVLSGECTIPDLRGNIQKYIRETWRRHPLKYGEISLDTPIFHDGTVTLADRLMVQSAEDEYFDGLRDESER